MRKIVITGPESAGKTTLAGTLARALDATQVEEVARGYLDHLGRPYEEGDLVAIAKAQLKREAEVIQELEPDGLLICDTDLITIRIWSEEKYGRCDPWIIEQTGRRHYDLWLLCRPDIPWEPDPQRENPHDRDRLFDRHVELLRSLGKPYKIIEGDGERRLSAAIDAIHAMTIGEI